MAMKRPNFNLLSSTLINKNLQKCFNIYDKALYLSFYLKMTLHDKVIMYERKYTLNYFGIKNSIKRHILYEKDIQFYKL